MPNTEINWVDLAKSIPVGKTIKIPHCSSSAKCYVTHQPGGYKRHCFRCGLDEFKSKGVLSIKESQDVWRYQNSFVTSTGGLEVPADYTLDVPEQHAVWYLQYGVSSEVASIYGIGWSDSAQRIILPVYDLMEDGDIHAIQARAVHQGQTPKYLNPQGPKTSDCVFFTGYKTGTHALVITEDILSAIKVGISGSTAMSIMGTSASDARAFKIAKYARENCLIPVVWLDPDQAGAAGTIKVVKKLSLYCDDVRVIRSDTDPKEHSRDYIMSLLKESLASA